MRQSRLERRNVANGTMVGIDLGTRLLKVNITKLRKDETRSPPKLGFDLPSSDDDLHKDLIMEHAKSGEKPAKRITARFANWNCVTKGRIQVRSLKHLGSLSCGA